MNLVLSGPSGSGKGTVTEKLLLNDKFKKFITCTTRNSRELEMNGFDYFFLSEKQFKKYVNNGQMFNVKEYDGHYYGSFEKDIDNIKTDSIMIFQLTPDRALEMKKNNPDTCLILLLPPSASELNLRRENRSLKRIEDDIDNLNVAKQFDYVVTNDDLNQAVNDVLKCIDAFKQNKNISNSMSNNDKLIDDFIKKLNNTTLSSKVENTFNSDIADSWDDKSRFVIYHGIKNPITKEVMENVNDGMKIADIGCGTGKLIGKIDKKVNACEFTGIDISDRMITQAEKKVLTGNNKTVFINRDFMKFDFNRRFDLIIFSYVLHHMANPVEALRKAKEMLSNKGIILFSVPGNNYLKETFVDDDLKGRYSIEQMDEIISEAGLYPMSACRNNFLMTFNTYEMYLNYLKSIGTYQKVIDYSTGDWSSEFNDVVMKRFNDSEFITGEYLTYNCVNKSNILNRR